MCCSRATMISIDETLRECEIKEQVAQTSPVDIHRQVLSRILRKPAVPLASSAPLPLSQEQSIESLQRRLEKLKQRRLHLVSELERNKISLTTVSEELADESRSRRHVRCDYDNDDDHNNEFTTDESTIMTSMDFAQRMHELRSRRRIASSHRIAGISVISCPEDSLGIRMDICMHGVYVNRHYLFFQLEKKNDNSKLLVLRLVQHTVPQGCICENDRTIPFDGSLMNLRQYIGEVYDKCYFHAVRKDAHDFLNSKDCVTDLICSSSLDYIAFMFKGMIQVQLEFSNLSALPSRVNVSRKPKPPMSGQDIVSDEDEDDDLLDSIKNVFCNNGTREAIGQVIKAID